MTSTGLRLLGRTLSARSMTTGSASHVKARGVAPWSAARVVEQVRTQVSAEYVTEVANIDEMRSLASVVRAREQSTARSACGAMGLANSSQRLWKPVRSAVEQAGIQQPARSAVEQAALLWNARNVVVLVGISSANNWKAIWDGNTKKNDR